AAHAGASEPGRNRRGARALDPVGRGPLISSRNTPVDPGCLPAWDAGELPEPPHQPKRGLLALIGPGLVMAGASIGTGEWVMGPAAAALYMQGKGALLWVVIASILAQVALNTEVMRYTICTGEPIFTGFMRS